MESKKKSNVNLVLKNKNGASKASAQLKIILSVLIFTIASAMLLTLAYAATFSVTINTPASDDLAFATEITQINITTGTQPTNCTYTVLNSTGTYLSGSMGNASVSHQLDNFDISSLGDGGSPYNFTIFCMNSTDSTDNETVVRTFFKDTVGPTVDWIDPNEDDTVSGNTTLEVDFIDNSDVALGTINFTSNCGGTIYFDYSTNCNESSAATIVKCNATWDTASATRGDCNITASANDTAQNYDAANRSFDVAYQCGDSISSSGTVTLTANLSTCDGNGITIFAHNVVLDCNGFWIIGDGDINENTGVKVQDSIDNATIKNCHISGYGNPGAMDAGIRMYSNHDNTVIFNNSIYSASVGIVRSTASVNADNNANITGNTILDTTWGPGIMFDNATGLTIANNVIRNTTGSGINITKTGSGISVLSNTINATGDDGIWMNYTTGLIQLNDISYATGEGIYLYESALVINNNTIDSGDEDGIEIYANGPVCNITNNTIVANGDDGLDISSSISPVVYHNNIFDNDALQARSGNTYEFSFGGEGNYWGNNTCPTFVPGVHASSSIRDSYAYNTTFGWQTFSVPPTCDAADIYLILADDDDGMDQENLTIGLGEDEEIPHNATFLVEMNDTNLTTLYVNLSHGGICIGTPNPLPMDIDAYSSGIYDFIVDCSINKTALDALATNNAYNFTVEAVSGIASDEMNFTLYYDFDSPSITFDWWETEDTGGSPITFPAYWNFFDAQDMFYSPYTNQINFKLNVTDEDVACTDCLVQVNLTNASSWIASYSTGGNCTGILNLSYSGGYYVGACSLGDFNETDIEDYTGDDRVASFDITYDVTDSYGNEMEYFNSSNTATQQECYSPSETCIQARTPILVHDLGIMGPDEEDMIEDDECYNFGSASTNFSAETNFSDIDFTMDMEVNMSCIQDYWNKSSSVTVSSDFVTMLVLNFTGIDFNSQEKAAKISGLADAIDVAFPFPGEFGESYIYLNSTYFEELNESATLQFYHLPFASEPSVTAGAGAAGLTGSTVWTAGADGMWGGKVAGNLTFNVLGFSQYDIEDNTTPIVTIDAPVASANLTSNQTWLNMSVNGTGTQMSNVLVYDGATLEYNYSATPSSCVNVSAGSELFFCNISLTGLSDGSHTLTVYAYDYGSGEAPGNNVTATRTFSVDTSAPVITIVTPANTTYVNSTITFNISVVETNPSACLYSLDGAANSTLSQSGSYWTATKSDWTGESMHNITYWCNDSYGNADVTTARYFTVDAQSPRVAIITPANNSNSTSSTFSVNISTNETYPGQLSLYVNGTLANSSSYSSGVAYTTLTASLADGLITFVVNSTDTAGNYNVTDTYTHTIDTISPTITNGNVSSITDTGATINSTTNEASTCRIEYGVNDSYGTNSTFTTSGTTHSKALTSLTEGTLYHFRWYCNDSYGNPAVGTDDTFTTTNSQVAELNESTTTNVTINQTVNGNSSTKAEMEISLNETVNATVNVTIKGLNPTNTSLTVTQVGDYYTLESDEVNSTNTEWVYIKIYYNESQVTAAGIDESTLRLYWYNTTSLAWEVITPGGVDTTNNYVWGNSTHFSEYTLGGSAAEEEEESSSSSGGGGSAPPSGLTETVNLDTAFRYTYENMKVNDILSFTLKSEQHTATLVSMTTDSVVMDISSETTRYTINSEESKAIDTDGNGINDLKVEVGDIVSGTADVTFDRIAEFTELDEEATVDASLTIAPEETESTPVSETISEIVSDKGNLGSLIVMFVVLAAGAAVVYYFFYKKKK